MLNTSQQELSIPDLFKGDLQLTAPPNVYLELQKITSNPTKSLADAAFIIEKDAALAIRLLKIVNSAFYGFPSKISSIDRAINLIGIKELQNIILSTTAIDKFSNLPGELISMHDFWAQNIRCALIAQKIDHHLNKEFSDAIFICGILHNIGQLVFFSRIPELARETSLRLQTLDHPTDLGEIQCEIDVIGFDHFQTGAALCNLWKLPELITESIRLHAYPDNTGPYHKLASIIRLANTCSTIDSNCCDDAINNLGISAFEISTIIESTHEEFEDIFKVFYHA
ncbi:MAG: HDOD domain-containing protein [Methylomarinum sp.]|nr:HDOD domain-containing protein [Methylomarinum sp.]